MTELLVVAFTVASAGVLITAWWRGRGHRPNGQGRHALARTKVQAEEANELATEMRTRGERNAFAPLIASALHKGEPR